MPHASISPVASYLLFQAATDGRLTDHCNDELRALHPTPAGSLDDRIVHTLYDLALEIAGHDVRVAQRIESAADMLFCSVSSRA